MTGKMTMRVSAPEGTGGKIETGPFTLDQLKAATRDLGRANRKTGNPPMKHDPDLSRAEDTQYRVSAGELRQFVERYERLEAEKKDIADQMKEVMAEAKGRGYDTKAMRKLIAERKREPQEIAEEEAVLEMYRAALEGGA
jgi:uncharacterized protein (UPF0335 family)